MFIVLFNIGHSIIPKLNIGPRGSRVPMWILEDNQSDMEKIIFYFIHFILTINLCANMGKDDLTGWA